MGAETNVSASPTYRDLPGTVMRSPLLAVELALMDAGPHRHRKVYVSASLFILDHLHFTATPISVKSS